MAHIIDTLFLAAKYALEKFNIIYSLKEGVFYLYENGVWAIFSTLDPRVLQYKPGLLLKPEVAEEMLDRTEISIGQAWAEVKSLGRSA